MKSRSPGHLVKPGFCSGSRTRRPGGQDVAVHPSGQNLCQVPLSSHTAAESAAPPLAHHPGEISWEEAQGNRRGVSCCSEVNVSCRRTGVLFFHALCNGVRSELWSGVFNITPHKLQFFPGFWETSCGTKYQGISFVFIYFYHSESRYTDLKVSSKLSK